MKHKEYDRIGMILDMSNLGEVPWDKSCRGNPMTNNGGVAWSPAGKVFDGVTAFVEVGNESNFDFGTGDYTISVWIKRNSTGVTEYIVSKYTTGLPLQYWIHINAANIIITGHRSETEGRWYVSSGAKTITNDSKMHNIVITRSRTVANYKIFLDGIDVSVNGVQQIAYNTNVNNNEPVRIGRSDTIYSKSLIKEVRILSNAKYAIQIMSERRLN